MPFSGIIGHRRLIALLSRAVAQETLPGSLLFAGRRGIGKGRTAVALAETINGLYKAEVIHRRGPWRSFDAVEFATLTWVDWFNNRRLLEPIGNIPPAEAEERYYAMLEEPAMAA